MKKVFRKIVERCTSRRFFEAIPGIFAWIILASLIFFSWRLPIWVVFFMVLYDLYWLLKTIYLSFYLRHTFQKMRRYLKIDWLEKLKTEHKEKWEDVYHLIIIPVYHEPYAVVRRCIKNLSEMQYPLEKFLITFAIEERGGEKDREISERMYEEFKNVFGGMIVTVHPHGISGELPGKGSNTAWSAKRAQEQFIDARKIPHEDVLVSVFDVDTLPARGYFATLAHSFLSNCDGHKRSYQPIPVYTNNFHKVSAFSRLVGFSATFWQMMQQSRPEQNVSFSSHTTPLKALIDVGYWHTDIVSEDSRIFFQCLVHYKGDWKVEPLFYPVYMDAVDGNGFWDSLKNLYKQQRRWAWGVENFGYIMEEFLKRKKIPLKTKLFWIWQNLDGKVSWATSSFIIFLFGWMPNALGGDAFNMTVFSYNLPRVTELLIRVATIGIASSAFLSTFLIPANSTEKKKTPMILYLLQWILTPFTLIVFSSLPALDALTRAIIGGKYRLGFWRTPKVG